MHNTGKVIDTWKTSEMATNKPCWGVETDAADVPMSPYNRPMNCIYVPLGGPVPAVGDEISFGPHHWWYVGHGDQFDKLGGAFARSDPPR